MQRRGGRIDTGVDRRLGVEMGAEFRTTVSKRRVVKQRGLVDFGRSEEDTMTAQPSSRKTKTHLVVAATKPRSSSSSRTFGAGLVESALRPTGRRRPGVSRRLRNASMPLVLGVRSSSHSAQAGDDLHFLRLDDGSSGLFASASRRWHSEGSWRSHGRVSGVRRSNALLFCVRLHMLSQLVLKAKRAREHRSEGSGLPSACKVLR